MSCPTPPPSPVLIWCVNAVTEGNCGAVRGVSRALSVRASQGGKCGRSSAVRAGQAQRRKIACQATGRQSVEQCVDYARRRQPSAWGSGRGGLLCSCSSHQASCSACSMGAWSNLNSRSDRPGAPAAAAAAAVAGGGAAACAAAACGGAAARDAAGAAAAAAATLVAACCGAFLPADTGTTSTLPPLCTLTRCCCRRFLWGATWGAWSGRHRCEQCCWFVKAPSPRWPAGGGSLAVRSAVNWQPTGRSGTTARCAPLRPSLPPRSTPFSHQSAYAPFPNLRRPPSISLDPGTQRPNVGPHVEELVPPSLFVHKRLQTAAAAGQEQSRGG